MKKRQIIAGRSKKNVLNKPRLPKKKLQQKQNARHNKPDRRLSVRQRRPVSKPSVEQNKPKLQNARLDSSSVKSSWKDRY